jgi:hypothetical protein
MAVLPESIWGLTCIATALRGVPTPLVPVPCRPLEQESRLPNYVIACVSFPKASFQFAFELEALKGDFRGFLFAVQRARMIERQ